VPADEIRLAVPARPEFFRLARVAASGVASRLGFSYDDVDDLRLAIDELCFALTGGRGREGCLLTRYAASDDALEVQATASFTVDGPRPALSELSEAILHALVDEHEVYVDDDGRPSFRLLKRRSSSQ
jgi:hypothetical protein